MSLLPAQSYAPPEEQSADFVELFFDLVFVFSITRITHMTMEHLSVAQALESVLVFWLVWWGWTQFTWALNASDTRRPGIRACTLVATAVAFVMATATDQVFGPGVMWFAVSYVIIRLLGLGLFWRVTPSDEGHRSAVAIWAALSLAGMVSVLGSALVHESSRVWWLLATIVLDMTAGLIAGRAEGWYLRTQHFVERHGLIIIIALGESLIVAGSAVIGKEKSLALVSASGLTVLLTCLLWWSYFAWVREYMEDVLAAKNGVVRARLGRDVYSFLHFPLICGVVGIAVSFEKILEHPDDALSLPVAAALGSGVFLFIGFTALSFWKVSGVILVPRLVILAASMGGIVLSIGHSPILALAIVSASIALISAVEWDRCWRKKGVSVRSE